VKEKIAVVMLHGLATNGDAAYDLESVSLAAGQRVLVNPILAANWATSGLARILATPCPTCGREGA
jgi:hypothetical protein